MRELSSPNILKDKSFVLRSTRITSKTYSTITQPYMDPNESTQIFTPHHKQQYFPLISQSTLTQQQNRLKQQLQEKDKQLKQRLSKLHSNLKGIQNKYKQNLKQGFENKIKSYRLQAVMERKLLKQTVGQNLRMNQSQARQEKHDLAAKKKQEFQINAFRKQQLRQTQIQASKVNYQMQKRKQDQQLASRLSQLQERNKSSHDRILSQQRHKDRKKNYLEYWKQQKIKKEQFQTKKIFLQKIVSNARRIKGLKQQLETIQERCERIIGAGQKQSGIKDKNQLFVTI